MTPKEKKEAWAFAQGLIQADDAAIDRILADLTLPEGYDPPKTFEELDARVKARRAAREELSRKDG